MRLNFVLFGMLLFYMQQGLAQSSERFSEAGENGRWDIELMDSTVVETVLEVDLQIFLLAPHPVDYKDIIANNVKWMNSDFKDYIHFNFDNKIQLLEDSFRMEVLKQNYIEDGRFVDSLSRHSTKGKINIFICPTEVDTFSDKELFGFTPVYKDWSEGYVKKSPKMDNLFIAFSSLETGSTFPHEMGHFFGLIHPWEMTKEERIKMKIADEIAMLTNFMNYDNFPTQFTKPQLLSMWNFAKDYRYYLLKKSQLKKSKPINSN